MENISLSLPKRSFASNIAFSSHKSIYNDVFGGPPKIGLPTLAPRFEDYTEIFGGFHTSQLSSIPVLQLPLTASDDSGLHFDVDYSEVFGGSEGFDCTASVEDLVGDSSGGYDSDSSGDPWSPAQSGSLSEELDPRAGSDKSQILSDGDFLQSSESISKQTASYNKSCHISAETVLSATGHVTNFSAVPGYTFSLHESPASWDGDDEDSSTRVTSSTNYSREYGARVNGEKQCKCSSNPSSSGSDTQRNDSEPLEIQGSSVSQNKPFVTVCDISLRTKPSRLPPPSRPPPALVVKKSEPDKLNAGLKSIQHYTSDRMADETAPPFFDVEINTSTSSEGRESENRNHQVKHRGTKELTERKYFRSHSAARVEEKMNVPVKAPIGIVEERIESTGPGGTQEISEPQGVQCCDKSADISAEDVAWREETGYFELLAEAKGNKNEVVAKLKRKGSSKRIDIEEKFVDLQIAEQTGHKHRPNILIEEFQRSSEVVKGAEMGECIQERAEAEGIQTKDSGVSENKSDKLPERTYDIKENDVIIRDSKKHTKRNDISRIAAGFDRGADRHLDCEKDMEAGKLVGNKSTSRNALGQARLDKDEKLIHVLDVNRERNEDVSNDHSYLRSRMAEAEANDEEGDLETTGNMRLSTDSCFHIDLSEHAEEIEPTERNGYDGRDIELDLDSLLLIDGDKLKASEGGCKVDEVNATKVLGKHDNVQMLKSAQRAISPEANGDMKNKPISSTYESETVADDKVVVGGSHQFSRNKDELQDENNHSASNDTVKSPCVPKQMLDSKTCGSDMGVSHLTSGKISSAFKCSHREGQKMSDAPFTVQRVGINDKCNSHQVITESTVSEGKTEHIPSSLKQNSERLPSKRDATGPPIEVKNPNTMGNLVGRDKKVGERMRSETAPEDEHMRKLEEEREREREREKDRMAVDRAALEARERSYFGARERAERAAVERTTAEVRQRALFEAQERLEKASAEARLRTDRAAVERATAEARQRASEKLMAQRAAYDPVERSLPNRFTDSSRYTDTRQSFLSSDIYFQGTGVSNRMRYSYPTAYDGAESESPQRCKARLERYRRTSERAANALAEKNRRDLLAQREREERNRVAETLDAEVKRWSSGKQGNLRALLSTLQYILGPDSGWHPVSLTEVITSAAAKKAYRRATLCVHPDKLQQRGATIQQKYICEKVFDLLKEAWSKFNSEER